MIADTYTRDKLNEYMEQMVFRDWPSCQWREILRNQDGEAVYLPIPWDGSEPADAILEDNGDYFYLTPDEAIANFGEILEGFKTDDDYWRNHQPPEMLTIIEAAQRFGVATSSVKRWIREGVISGGLDTRGRWLVPADRIEAVINRPGKRYF